MNREFVDESISNRGEIRKYTHNTDGMAWHLAEVQAQSYWKNTGSVDGLIEIGWDVLNLGRGVLLVLRKPTVWLLTLFRTIWVRSMIILIVRAMVILGPM